MSLKLMAQRTLLLPVLAAVVAFGLFGLSGAAAVAPLLLPGGFPLPSVNLPPTWPRLLRTMLAPGIGPSVRIRDVPVKGKGAFTTRRVEKAAFLGYYHGEYLSSDDVFERYPILAKADPPATRTESLAAGVSYLFALDFDGELYVDAKNLWLSNWVRYVNHSERRQNAIAYIDDADPARPMIYLEATRDIEAGEEILVDYGEEYWEGVPFKVLD
jgi:hypothetical protein